MLRSRSEISSGERRTPRRRIRLRRRKSKRISLRVSQRSSVSSSERAALSARVDAVEAFGRDTEFEWRDSQANIAGLLSLGFNGRRAVFVTGFSAKTTKEFLGRCYGDALTTIEFGRNGDWALAKKEKCSHAIHVKQHKRDCLTELYHKAKEIVLQGNPVIVIGAGKYDPDASRVAIEKSHEMEISCPSLMTEEQVENFAQNCQDMTQVVVFLDFQFYIGLDLKFGEDAICLCYFDGTDPWEYETLMQAFGRAARTMTTFLGHCWIRDDPSNLQTWVNRYQTEGDGPDFLDGADNIRIANNFCKLSHTNKARAQQQCSPYWCQERQTFMASWHGDLVKAVMAQDQPKKSSSTIAIPLLPK